MPPRYAATVSCPSCGTRFQTPVEQILDVRVDPAAKNRVLSGTTNVAVCPSCGTGGALNLPFIYHDPDNDVALLYLPVESGATEVDRQRGAGRLTRQLMDAMPMEERRGYLLQPETFISIESLVKRVLEIEGISEEEMAHSQQQREFLGALLQAPEQDWPEMVSENASFIDEGLFAFLEYVIQLSSSAGQQAANPEVLAALHEYLVEQTEVGQLLARRSTVVHSFADDPTRDTLLSALVQAPDSETVEVLVQSGISLMDYAFFQKLNQRIDEAGSEAEQTPLQELRRAILDQRDRLMEQSEGAVRERSQLLGRLLATEDPQRMASSHLSELDDLFFAVLGAQMKEAQEQGNMKAAEDLQRVATAVNQVMESTMPPELALTRRLMAAPTAEQLDQQLQSIKQLLTPAFLQFLTALEASMREQGQEEAAARVATIQARAREISPQPQPEVPSVPAPAVAEDSPRESEERTASGLIIAKR